MDDTGEGAHDGDEVTDAIAATARAPPEGFTLGGAVGVVVEDQMAVVATKDLRTSLSLLGHPVQKAQSRGLGMLQHRQAPRGKPDSSGFHSSHQASSSELL
jgi:hypothetical protein